MPDTIAPVRHTLGEFAHDLLQRLGLPQTRNNAIAILAWAVAEGGAVKNSAHFNPLNTTLYRDHSTSINSAGVQSYKDYETGLSATADTLAEPRYAAIRQHLANDDPAGVTAASVAASRWGTGGAITSAVTRVAANVAGFAATTIGLDRPAPGSLVDRAVLAVGDPVIGAAKGAAKAVTSIGDLLSTPHLAVRAVEVIGGAVLALLGLVFLGRALGMSVPLPGPLGAIAKVAA